MSGVLPFSTRWNYILEDKITLTPTEGDKTMKNNFGNHRGVKVSHYKGPKLVVEFSYKEPTGQRQKLIVKSPLSNPRKSEQSVLQGICADVKRNHPTSKLVEFHRKEPKSIQR